MPELRKRPQREPPAPAPASKRSRAKAAPAETQVESSTSVPESSAPTGVVGKAKRAIKNAITGPIEASETGSTESAAKQPSVEDEPASAAAVESGETGIIPETAGTAPSTTTVPAAAEETKTETPAAEAAAAAATATTTSATPATIPLSSTSTNKTIPSLPTFGGTVLLHTGTSTTFHNLLTASKSGLIIFTYPKASTPGCTTQACSFRDNHSVFTSSSGYTIYGLSTDSPKANTTFVTKQGLGYELLCDKEQSLIKALGMGKGGGKTGRGVVVVDGDGTVRVWMQGGPGATVDAVKEFLGV